MKKIALTILLAISAFAAAHAQTAYDAWLFSENNYEGTARSVAMGNAFTALGGDLGSVGINPAGSAVAGYSQISITPSLTFSTNTAVGIPYEGSTDPYFQKKMRSRDTNFNVPNLGLVFNFETGRTSGVKAVTFGFVMNTTNSWNENVYANGINSNTSFLAALASDATNEIADLNYFKSPAEPDYTKGDYMAENAFEYMNWQNTVGYRSGMFSAFDEDGKRFAGATETVLDNGNLIQSGEVEQTYGRQVYGNKSDYIMNLGLNISDFLYLGFNLGVNSLTYDYTHYFKEAAVDQNLFENRFTDSNGYEYITYFRNANYKHSYSAEGSGFYGKFGFILTPGAGFRFGAAIQTPTSTRIKEQWQDRATTRFSDSKFDGDAESDLGYNEYRFNSPLRANFGAAITFGRFAVVSADYEVAAYGRMKYKFDRHDMDQADIDYFEGINEEIRETYGNAHYLRVGVEVKPTSTLAVRAGYNLSTSAQKKYYDAYLGDYEELVNKCGNNLSLGLGYISKKSFFADVACRYKFATDEYIYPYSDYLADYGILSPEILNRHSNWKVLLTLGWRF